MDAPPVIPYGTPPPIAGESYASAPPMSEGAKKGLWGGLLGVGLLFAKFGKVALVALKGAKFLPFVKTFATMFLTIWVYSMIYTWKFAAGFVVGILIHEMGHVAAAAAMGVPVSAPLFIPFFGAMILRKEGAKSAWGEAVIGIGGPIAGMIAGLIFLGISLGTSSDLFMALAYVTFLMNLFNLTPVFPLDGGWITGSISPRIWLVGIILLATMFLTGMIGNPFILVLILMSLPRLWAGLRHGHFELHPGQEPSNPKQKWIMGVSYVGLCILLAFLTFETHDAAAKAREVRYEPKAHAQ